MLGALEGFGVITVIILTGLLVGRTGILGEHGQQVLAKLVFYVGTPCLLYVTLTEAEVSTVFSSALLATGGSSFVLALGFFFFTRWAWKSSWGEATMCGWSVSYVNIGNLGIPIATYVLGSLDYVAPVLLFQLLVLAPIGMAILDATRSGAVDEGRPGGEWWRIVLRVFKNPIVLGSLVGVAGSLTGFRPPEVIYEPVSMMGAIAVPATLLAFGISLKDGWAMPARGTRGQLATITALKLVGQPTLAWAIGGPWLGYTGTDLLAIVVTSALPTAQNVYMYSLQYKQSPLLMRDAVFITTIGSVPVVIAAAAIFG